MSDPVSNADIEDVLSSIRRLVSENPAPQPAGQNGSGLNGSGLNGSGQSAQGQSQGRVPSTETVDKLVLTPAFRVHENTTGMDAPERTETPVSEDAIHEVMEDAFLVDSDEVAEGRGDAEDFPTQTDDDVMFLHRPLNLAQEDGIADTVEDPGAEEGDVPTDEAFSDPRLEAGMEQNGHEVTPEPAVESDQGEGGVGVLEQSPTDAGDLAEDHPTFAAPQGDAVEGAEGGESLDPAEDAFVSTSAQAEPEASEETTVVVASVEDMTSDAAASEVEDNSGLEHRVAELEAAVNDSHVEFEPDLGDAVEDLGPGIFLRRRAQTHMDAAQPDSAPSHEQDETPVSNQDLDDLDAELAAFIEEDKNIDGVAEAASADDEDTTLFAEDQAETDLIDEDMLRDLVMRLVREELQGAVGEKITRNVRRLVRREVERALTLRSLE
ncbi:hypothetical protein SAMN04488527_11022 [Aliiroseovarius crassostreae]|uniref:Uncharacterized protein n=1 Tax=Aliiroseovarius crassostreae TaxID=154981 RepID=A0A0P7KLW3_9RHOB|nr:hypothetical protein [Aliiroseovarius crassostreae]KPN63066.1 hypothetical protein AKJ29_02670 [Aliiroseovarius crassostreae]SFU66976.1 hypothetical protein SAMN04488527_11022 [Aliiroseovarius crassostreae]